MDFDVVQKTAGNVHKRLDKIHINEYIIVFFISKLD